MTTPLLRRNLTDFFRELLQAAMSTHDVRSSEDAEFYLVKLLEGFASPRRDWFERPLAVDFLEAFQSRGRDRYTKLKHVGDTSLFLSGMFMEALERTPVGCDYYIDLGQLAYGHLAQAPIPAGSHQAFAELSERFREFVSVLSEISFSQLFRGERHLLRVYTRWFYTRNRRDQDWLARHGLIPMAQIGRTRH